ncbi:MAG TPA: hypothetical protein VMW10_07905, partial [Alphaproteobacteria bacterium]|nr:hypothetical protein [Alphaproteobacteria bacterium]
MKIFTRCGPLGLLGFWMLLIYMSLCPLQAAEKTLLPLPISTESGSSSSQRPWPSDPIHICVNNQTPYSFHIRTRGEGWLLTSSTEKLGDICHSPPPRNSPTDSCSDCASCYENSKQTPWGPQTKGPCFHFQIPEC